MKIPGLTLKLPASAEILTADHKNLLGYNKIFTVRQATTDRADADADVEVRPVHPDPSCTDSVFGCPAYRFQLINVKCDDRKFNIIRRTGAAYNVCSICYAHVLRECYSPELVPELNVPDISGLERECIGWKDARFGEGA